jgi:hypothetical protein
MCALVAADVIDQADVFFDERSLSVSLIAYF